MSRVGTSECGSSPAKGNPHKWVVCGVHEIRHVASYECPVCRWGADAAQKARYIQPVERINLGGEE